MLNDFSKYLNQYKDIYGSEIYINDNLLNQNQSRDKKDLLNYYESIKNCLDCQLGHTRNNFVFGEGNPNSDIVFIGEAPGEKEDLLGRPFVGKSGKLLDKILSAINSNREDIYILNIVKCRPPNNRNPLQEEIEKCERYLKKQLEIIKPKLIVTLGRVSSMTILKTNKSLADLRNKIHKYQNIDLIATYHPAALLRNPNLKKGAWEDFKLIKYKYIDAC